MEYLSLGKVIDAFGLDGTLKILSSTYYGDIRYEEGNIIILVHPNGTEEKLTVVSYRNNKEIDYVKFLEINTKEEALERKGSILKIEKDESTLGKGDYYFSDLEKCEVYHDKSRLGKVIKVEEFPSVITLRVRRDNGKDFFVPFIKDFIQKVDIKNYIIYINLIEGML